MYAAKRGQELRSAHIANGHETVLFFVDWCILWITLSTRQVTVGLAGFVGNDQRNSLRHRREE